jgi:lysophospholipase L1-like esterase
MSGSSGSHDRRGFQGVMNGLLVLLPVCILLMIVYSWQLGMVLGLSCLVAFITLEAVSARPDNNPSTFIQWARRQDRRRPVLLCLGDSLTHGNCSASYTPDIPYKLAQSLGLPLPELNKTFSDPLWVVNAGQNCITSHTILNDRLNTALGSLPDYVLLLIGTNDVRAMYKKSWCREVMYVNGLTETPNLKVLERNLVGILRFIHEASPNTEIGVCTLPPMGENLRSTANDLVRQANNAIERAIQQADSDRVTLVPLFDALENVLEKQKRGWSIPVDYFPLIAMVQNPIYHLVTLFSTWNLLSEPFGFHVMSDGLHLNERGRDILVDLIVEWLTKKGIAKAIAVKR